jgi:hypothetical protein
VTLPLGGAAGPADAGGLVCSAKGCRAPAAWALHWNNPRLHPPERRKTWLACADHRESLGEFLAVRGFLREVEPAPTAPAPPAEAHPPVPPPLAPG